MSVDLLAMTYSGHVDDEVDCNETSHISGEVDYTALAEEDQDDMAFNDHEAMIDGQEPVGHDLENEQAVEHKYDAEKATSEENLTDDANVIAEADGTDEREESFDMEHNEAEDGFEMEHSNSAYQPIEPDDLASLKIPEVEITFDPNEAIATENADSTSLAPLITGSNIQQEDAMSEIDYDHNDDDSVDPGTHDQSPDQSNAAGLEDQNSGDGSGHVEEMDMMPVENGRKEGSDTDLNQPEQQETSHLVDFQEDHVSEIVENTDLTGSHDVTEVEALEMPQAEDVDVPNDQYVKDDEGLTMDPLEHENDHDDTDYLEVTELGHLSDDFSNPPNVQVHYRGTRYALFQKSYEDHPDTFFFSDMEALDFPLSQFLASLREVVEDVDSDDEVLIRIDDLGLEFAETTDKKILDQTNFRSLVDLHDRLMSADKPESENNSLQVYLVTRPNCQRRLEALVDSARIGEGLEAYRLSYPDYLTIDFPPKSMMGSDEAMPRQNEGSDVDIGEFDKPEGEELDDIDVEEQASEEQMASAESFDDALQEIADDQVIAEKDQSALVSPEHAQSLSHYDQETGAIECGGDVDDDAIGTLLDISEMHGDSGATPSHAEEDEEHGDPEYEDLDGPGDDEHNSHEVEEHASAEAEDHYVPDVVDSTQTHQHHDSSASAGEVHEEFVDDHLVAETDEQPGPDAHVEAFQNMAGEEHKAQASYELDVVEDFEATGEEAVAFQGSPAVAETLPEEADHDDILDVTDVGQDEWQDQGNAEDLPQDDAGDSLLGDESEQTSASGTLAGDDGEAMDAFETMAPGDTDNVADDIVQNDADEIDWEDKGEEPTTGDGHLSTPTSNSGKRGRADDSDESGGEHDVKRHRV